MGRVRYSGPVKSTGGIEIGAAASGMTAETNTTAIDSSGNLYQAGVRVFNDMTPGTGISTGTNTICEHSVTKIGGIYKTEILIDLTGLNGCGAAGDIIGVDGGTANCHIGQITAAVNGTIIAGMIECHETPAGGNADINLYSATESTGAQDAAISGLVETELVNAGAHSAGGNDFLTAWPAADEYLYLTTGANTDADFTAGRLLITLWGV